MLPLSFRLVIKWSGPSVQKMYSVHFLTTSSIVILYNICFVAPDFLHLFAHKDIVQIKEG